MVPNIAKYKYKKRGTIALLVTEEVESLYNKVKQGPRL